MFYFQARIEQSEPFHHLSSFSSYYGASHSQVIPSHGNGDSWTNVSQLGTPKHMPHLYPRHKQDQHIPLLSRGPGPRPNLDSKPPPTWVPDSVWCLDLHYPRLQSVGPERAGTHDKKATSLPTRISKYVLGIINLWPDYHPQQRTVLNRHGQGRQCNQAMPHGYGTKPIIPTNTHTISLPNHHFPFHHFIMSVILISPTCE